METPFKGKPEPLSITTPLPEMVFWHDEKNINNINPTSQSQIREVMIPIFFQRYKKPGSSGIPFYFFSILQKIFNLHKSMKPTLLILAAGIGSRYGGVKQMDEFGPSGESIIDYSVFDAIRAGFGKVVFVLNPKIEKDFKAIYEQRLSGKIETAYVLQKLNNIPEDVGFTPKRVKPWGTGHAVLVAKEVIDTPFAVINADDFYGRQAFEVLGNFLSQLNNDETRYAMVGYQLKNTLSENGSVSRGICSTKEGLLTDVVERTKIYRTDGQIVFEEAGREIPITGNSLVSMNFWGFTSKYFAQSEAWFVDFIRENARQLKAEFYIPYVVNKLITQGNANVQVLESHDRWFGVTYQEDKAVTIARVRQMVREGRYPESLWDREKLR
jgi:UTP-glucose-1-phosphate uridylyltransferase